MTENVEYVLNLKDNFSSKIKDADKAAVGLNSTMAKFAGMAVAGFGIAGAFSFINKSIDAFDEQAKAVAQLDAALVSTGGAAGLTKDALLEQASALQKTTLFGDEATVAAQSLLLTFTNIKGEIFNNAIPAIQDLATRMGTDLKGATVQVGKALNDPIKGVSALQRVGVSFTESQKDVIKTLVETGQTAEAQKLILQELNSEFGGSSQAAASVGKAGYTQFKNAMGDVQEKVGELAVNLLNKLLPAMNGFVNLMDKAVDWLKENKDLIYAVGVSVGVLAAAWVAYQIPLILTTTLTTLMTAAQWALNAALNANPIGVVVVALAALAGGMYYAYQKSEALRGIVFAVWEVLKSFGTFVTSYFKSIGEIISGVFTLDVDMIKNGVKGAIEAYKELGNNVISGAKSGYEKGVISQINDELGTGSVKAKPPTGKGPSFIGGESEGKTKAAKAGSVTGSKSYNINITIGNLVKDFSISTTNITEGAGKVKDLVTQALLSAVNDSQIIAER